MKVEVSNPIKPILVAIIANTIIAISKAIGFLMSGSSALLSETIHSIADVFNQSFLLIGVKMGNRGETEILNYGHSQERFFWNLLSAVGIFVLGCGVTLYHGIHELMEEHKPVQGNSTEQWIIITILLISMIVELYSFKVASHEIKIEARARGKKFFNYLNESIDPSVSAIFWEDLAAIIGIALALFGILMTQITGDRTFDIIATILIGLLMGWIAYHLGMENKKFLIDRSIPQHELNQIIGILKSDKKIISIENIKSIILGPYRLKFRADLELDTELMYKDDTEKLIENLKSLGIKDIPIDKLKELIKEHNKEILKTRKNSYTAFQKALQEKIPNLKHIDLT